MKNYSAEICTVKTMHNSQCIIQNNYDTKRIFRYAVAPLFDGGQR